MTLQKRHLLLSLGLVLLSSQGPSLAQPDFMQTDFTQADFARTFAPQQFALQTAQANTKPKLELTLMGDWLRQVPKDRPLTGKNAQRQTETQWQSLGSSQAQVVPGDVIRFTLKGVNNGQAPAKNVVLNQPIPKGTAYIAQSARLVAGKGAIQFSIDGGKSFSEIPTIPVRQADGKLVDQTAPVDRYTHIQFRLSPDLAPNQTVHGEYQVRVR